MTALPPIKFYDLPVAAVDPPKQVLDMYFPNYIILNGPTRFWKEMHEQAALLEMMARGLGLGADAMQVLGGIDPRVRLLRRYLSLQKVPGVVEVVKREMDFAIHRKLVIFATEADGMKELEFSLKDYGAKILFPGTPLRKRAAYERRFKSSSHHQRIFIVHTKAAKFVDLTVARHAIFLEPDWQPIYNLQCAARIHNARQTGKVKIRFAQLPGTLDEKITRLFKNTAKQSLELFNK